ncbi:polysaccharide deacetylase family protein [Amycolatopsis rhizosphaerae]|uniref:polysaccharide deacetylase family protein n=1 Tax=Amycolatopsis rhizosphaerae TaxID=2053003 RepID=UPI001643A769|nr:polysaccharide deacetylase family protein [Amycolatopsis rhizosphaerae]
MNALTETVPPFRRRSARRRTGGRLGVLATALLLTTGLAPAARAAGAPPETAAVFTRAYDTTAKVVTLTFDADWWSPGDTNAVLNILRDNKITAGFALTGRYAEKFPDQTRALLGAGHKLINATYDHPYLTMQDQAQRWSEMDRAEAVFNRLGFSSAGWFRTPYRDGYLDQGVNRDLARHGYYVNYDWTFDTTGDQGTSIDAILARVRQYTVPGATIRMHLSDNSTDVAALGAVINTLRSMGYGFADPSLSVTRGVIGRKYADLGAEHSPVGTPGSAELAAAPSHGAEQWYQGGRIFWREDLGAHEVHGAIGARYFALGGPDSFLSYPVTDETEAADGGRLNHFVAGSIYFSPATGAHEVHGIIRDKWATLGSERGLLHYPTTDETAADGGGRFNHFQDGSIYYSPATGAHEVYNVIRSRWAALGWERGVLRYPTTDETPAPDGVGRYNHFQGGSIYYTPATGAHEVHGAIRDKWAALNWEKGFLGYPTTDEYAVTGGRAGTFQGGIVYFSPATGAHEMNGAILGQYLQLGGPDSRLGLPVSDEYPVPEGRRSDFQHGSILWNTATRTAIVRP